MSPSHNCSRSLRLESLESRWLMAGEPEIVGSTMFVAGTPGDDVFAYVASSAKPVRVNGVSFVVPATVNRIEFTGGGGVDSMTAWISSAVELRPGYARWVNPTHVTAVLDMDNIRINATTPGNAASLFDIMPGSVNNPTAASSTFVDRGDYARMFSPAFYDNVVVGFSHVTAYSTGYDEAWFYNLPGAHVFSGRETSARSFNSTHEGMAFGFDKVWARGGDGEGDHAELHGSAGDDRFTASPTEARLWGAGFGYVAYDFDKVVGRGGVSGNDTAELLDGAGDDELVGWPIFARLTGAGHSLEAKAFDVVHARAIAGGNDTAWLYDGDGFDKFDSSPQSSSLEGNGGRNVASGFDLVVSRSTHGGGDGAEFHDSPGDDTLWRKGSLVRLRGAGFDNRALGYNVIAINADQGGVDEAWLAVDVNTEGYSASGHVGTLSGDGRQFSHIGIEQVHVPMPPPLLMPWSAVHVNFELPPGPLEGWRDYASETLPGPDFTSFPGPGFWEPSLPITQFPGPGFGNPNFNIPIPAQFTITYHEQPFGDQLALGEGVAHPWKLLTDPADPAHILAITGEGEQGGASFLYLLDAQTLTPVRAPLAVGSSASDIVWVGRHVAISARNSAEVVLVDVDAWQVTDRAAVFQDPISVSAMDANRFAVASIRVKELQIFSALGGELALERKITLPGIAYDATFDAQNNRFYVNLPAIGKIVEVDAASSAMTREHDIGGEPSYGGMLMGRFYIATDRDGYVHFIDRTTGAANHLDLHDALGLDRATAAVRGIDPTDLVVLDDQHFIVINNRQDSLLYRFESDATFQQPVVRARFAGAAFGAGVSPVGGSAFGAHMSPAEILVTTPSLNRIDRVTFVETNGAISVTSVPYTVGVSPVAAVRMGEGPGATLAVLTSDHTLNLVAEFGGERRSFQTLNGYSVSARNPLAVDEHGRLWIVVNSPAGRRLLAVTAEGAVQVDVAAPLTSPFSIVADHGMVIVVDRTNQQLLVFDVVAGNAGIITLPHERPRHAEILGPDEWLVIHDTTPHIGVTHSAGGVRTFQPYSGGRWLAASTLDAAGQPIFLDFNGRVMTYDLAQRSYRTWLTLANEPAMTATFGFGRLWVVSPADSTVAIVRPGAAAPETIWADARAYDVIPAEGGAWLVTAMGLVWRSLNDPAWQL